MTSAPHAIPKLVLGLVHESKSESEFESEHMPFSKFFKDWLKVQDQDLHELMAIATAHSESAQSSTGPTQSHLSEHVSRVMSHYGNYYRDKLEAIKENVLLVLSPDWLSKLEDAFLWIGGWRPTIAFHLLYSKAGLQFEESLPELLTSGVTAGDLGDLSSQQLVQVDELQRKTIREERKLTESLAPIKRQLLTRSWSGFQKTITELTHSNESTQKSEFDSFQERVNKALALKEHGLQEILVLTDELRYKTLKSVVDILSPIQAVHFLIATTQHHLRVHEWGIKKDEDDKTEREARGLAGPKPDNKPKS
ncbi:Protein DOG1-like 3 [Bienertia sinuspersici]